MSPRRDGIVLILLSGIVAIMLFLALLILQISRSLGRSAEAGLAASQARLATASGMDYAASRLAGGAFPLDQADASSRGDDWTFRDPAGTATAQALNPSFDHGEPWLDGGAAGRYDGETALVDLGGDGRRSAWSGRLRGGRGAYGLSFSLAIATPEGGIPVNVGFLTRGDEDGFDNDNDGTVDEPGEDRNLNAVPDYQDLGLDYHKGLAHVLNNLGALALPPSCIRRENRTTAGHTFLLSWLGSDLVSRRPRGGYRTPEGLRSALLSAGYADSDIDAVLPYLDLGPYDGIPAGGILDEASRYAYIPYAPVNLHAAPREVLQSLWMYLIARPKTDRGNPPLWGSRISSRSGVSFDWTWPCIYPDEASAIADRLLALRGAGRLTWWSLREDLVRNARILFSTDFGDLSDDGPPKTGYSNAAYWTLQKADLAFQAVAVDRHFYQPGEGCSLAMEGWGISRPMLLDDGTPAPDEENVHSFGRNPYGEPDVGFLQRPAVPLGSWPGMGPFYGNVPAWTQGGTLAPPVWFRVESAGRSGAGSSRAGGLLRAGLRIELTSQEDFENLSGGAGLEPAGIRAAEPPGMTPALRRHWATVGGRAYAQISSLPRYNRRTDGGSAAQALGSPKYGFSRAYGALALASREIGLGTGKLYWSITEDFDFVPGNNYVSEGVAPFNISSRMIRHPAEFYDLPNMSAYAMQSGFQSPAPKLPGWSWEGASPPPAPTAASPWLPLVDQASIVAWLSNLDPSSWLVQSGPTVKLDVAKIGDGVRFQLFVSGVRPKPYNGPNLRPVTVSKTWTFPRAQIPAGRRHGFHTCVTARRVTGAGRPFMEFLVYINGSNANPDPSIDGEPQMRLVWTDDTITDPAWYPCVGIWKNATTGILETIKLDEIRLHDAALSAAAVASLAGADRFVRRGVYTSPLYILQDGAARIPMGQFTGAIPSSFTANPFTVRVQAYADAGGMSLLSDDPLDPAGRATRLPAFLSPARSFRYTVDMSCAAEPPGIQDTPVFESIWLTLSGNGRSPIWAAWESR